MGSADDESWKEATTGLKWFVAIAVLAVIVGGFGLVGLFEFIVGLVAWF